MWVEFDNQNVDTKYYYTDTLIGSKVIKAHVLVCAHSLRKHRSFLPTRPIRCERDGKLQTQTRFRSESCVLDYHTKMWHMSTIFYICPLQKYLCNCCTSFCFTSCILFNLLKPTCYVMHQQFNIQQLYVLLTLYLCVLYLSQKKQRVVPLSS
jgi:hypothetical protein